MTAPNTPAETSDQLNKPAKSGKLEVSDLITIGVFAALYFVMVCIATLVSTLFTSGFGSIFLPAITALISGCVYMLLAARLGKFGGITVMGVIIGLFLFISGHFVLSFIASIVFPVAADLIARAGKYKSKALLLVSYVVFSYGLTGPILPLWFMKDAYVASLQARGKDAAYIISRINGFTYVETDYDFATGELKIVREKAFSDGDRAAVRCYGANDVLEGVAIMKMEQVDVSITGNSTNPTRFQHLVAGTYKKWAVENGRNYFSVASGGGTGRTLHPDNVAAGPASYGLTDSMGRMHSDAQFAGSSSVPAHVEMMGLIGMGNNPMVGATVACAVAVEQASR